MDLQPSPKKKCPKKEPYTKKVCTCECTFFPDSYRRFCHLLDHYQPYLITGKVEQDYGVCTLTVSRIDTQKLHESTNYLAVLSGGRNSLT